MNTSIYTFINKKVVLVNENGQVPQKYYILKNWQEFSDLVDKFLKVDAVATPADITKDSKFPIFLELKSGFGVNFKYADINKVKEEMTKLKSQIKELESALKSLKK